jgi:hypothetical protein
VIGSMQHWIKEKRLKKRYNEEKKVGKTVK